MRQPLKFIRQYIWKISSPKIRPILVKYCFFQRQLGNTKYQIFFWAGISMLSCFILQILSLERVEVLAWGFEKPVFWNRLFEIHRLRQHQWASTLLPANKEICRRPESLKWVRKTFCSSCTYKILIWSMLKIRGFNHSTSSWLVPSTVPSPADLPHLLLMPKDFFFLCIFHVFLAL